MGLFNRKIFSRKTKKTKDNYIENLENATNKLIEEYDRKESDLLTPEIVRNSESKKSSNKKKWIIGTAALVAFSFAYTGIKDYVSNIRSIDFYDKYEEVYLGSSLDLNFEINPKSADYNDEDIVIVFENSDLLQKEGDSYIANKEGIVKAYIQYNDKNYDMKTFSLVPVKVDKIVVNDIEIGKNFSSNISIKIEPDNATNKNYSLTTDDTSIIEIKDNVIYGLMEGLANVTVVSDDGVRSVFKVNVKNIEPESMFFSNLQDNYVVGTETNVNVRFNPAEISENHITWNSSNPGVANIDEDGKLVINSVGNTIITASYSENIKCSKEITAKYPLANSIEVGTNYNQLYEGSSTRLWVNFSPEKVDNTTITWSSSNSNIVKVDTDGVITAIAVGKATITAKTNNFKSDSIDIECIEKPVQNTITRSNASMNTSGGTTYVLNTSTKKFHYSWCSSVNQMKDSNKQYSSESRDTIIGWGYSSCGRCNP